MNISLKYALPALWLGLFLYRLVLDATDQVSLWALRCVSLAIIVWVAVVSTRFVHEQIRLSRRGEQVAAKLLLHYLLLAMLGLGLALRLIAWDPGNEGIVAWIGGIMLVVSLVGLFILGLLSERSVRVNKESFTTSPYWKYGLIFVCAATLTFQGIARPEGAVSTVNVWLFLIALIGITVQGVGRWRLRKGHPVE